MIFSFVLGTLFVHIFAYTSRCWSVHVYTSWDGYLSKDGLLNSNPCTRGFHNCVKLWVNFYHIFDHDRLYKRHRHSSSNSADRPRFQCWEIPLSLSLSFILLKLLYICTHTALLGIYPTELISFLTSWIFMQAFHCSTVIFMWGKKL